MKFKYNFCFILIFLFLNPNKSNAQYKDDSTNGIYIIIYGFKKMISDLGYDELSNKIPSYGYLTDEIQVEFILMNRYFGPEYKGTIAIAAGSSDDNKIHILIDTIEWSKLNDLEQIATIFHELSHDVFNFKHVKWDEFSLMHPNSQPSSYDQLTQMTIRMMENNDYDLIEYFKPGEIYIHNTNSFESKSKIYRKSDLFK